MNTADTFTPRYFRRLTLPNCLALLLCCLLAIVSGRAEAAEIIDQDGQVLKFAKPFSRIISLYPAHTENLAQLGLNQEIIGISISDNYPAAMTGKPRFSDEDNAEKFLAASPDLLLIRPMIARAHPDLVKKLRQSGIAVVSLQPTTIDQMFTYWQTLGELTGRADLARDMREQFLTGVATIRTTLPEIPADKRPGVYFEAIHAKMKTFSPTAIAIYALETAGGRNIAADASARNASNIAEYGKERILDKAEEIDVFLSQQGRMNRIDLETLKKEPGFQVIKAFKEDRVYLIDETRISRPTLRLLEGIEEIAACLYPSR